MKATEFVKLASVRASMKNANTPSAKVKFLYVLAQENGGEDLRAILPAKKDDAIKLIADVCKANNVGGTRTITHKDGTTTEQEIKFSADMFVRYLCKQQNDGARTIEKAAKAEKRAQEKAARDARKAEEEKAKAEKKAQKEAEKAKREETAQKHLAVAKARKAA